MLHRVLLLATAALAILPAAFASTNSCPVSASTAPGGFLEAATSTTLRPKLSASQVAALLPSRGTFPFPAPYGTTGIRLTNQTDCGGTNCVQPVGYSYWRNINNHTCSDYMLIFLGLDPSRGGTGPTLFQLHKPTGTVTNRGPLFPATDPLRSGTGEGWYFSGSRPEALYIHSGSRLLRYDVMTQARETVFDVAPSFGTDKYVWQAHSSDDDRVHSVTLRDKATSSMLGCLVYREDTAQFQYFPKVGAFDECHVDKSGRWLVILDNVDGRNGEDNRIIDLETGAERLLLDETGAAGHADLGYGYMVTEDNWGALPGTARLWQFDQPLVAGPTQGRVLYHTTSWSADIGHITHGNAQAGLAEGQIVCSSNATAGSYPRSNEIVCYRADGSLQVLVVAPVMTELSAGGAPDNYSKRPKGNLDVTGQYFLWTTNMGSDRLDAFLVRVPTQRLGGGGDQGDVKAPTVHISSPSSGATVQGTLTASASAADAGGVAGVRFELDGQPLGVEDTTAPYTVAWNTRNTPAGTHALRAIARDNAGNQATSPTVTVVVTSDLSPPLLSNLQATGIGTSSATIVWSTDEPASSGVQYGTTTTYSMWTTLGTGLTRSHAVEIMGLRPGTVYHYRVLSRDAARNLAISTDRTFTTPQATGAAMPSVVWTSAVNCTVDGGSLGKSSGHDGVDDARARSEQQLTSGNGVLEFTALEPSSIRIVGLTAGAPSSGWSAISFAVWLGPWAGSIGVADVRENGVWKADTPYTAGDRFRIAVESGVVRYYKNGVPFYTSSRPPSYPLVADASILSLGGTIRDATMHAVPPGGLPEDEERNTRKTLE